MRILFVLTAFLAPVLASAHSHIYARDPVPHAYAIPFAEPGGANSVPRLTRKLSMAKIVSYIQCDHRADNVCWDNKPCKTGHYIYRGTVPRTEARAEDCYHYCFCT